MQRELSSEADVRSATRSILGGLAVLLWQLVRTPLYLVLAVLEPFVSIALCLLLVIAIFTALLFHFAIHATHFPLGVAIAFALGCAVLLVLYHGLMALLAR